MPPTPPYKPTQTRLLLLLLSLLILSCTPKNQNKTIMIPMRDGVKLSTQILYPLAHQKQYPVVLVRTPYKKEMLMGYYNYLLENGYVVALQDVRGRFGSDGEFEPFVNESQDGYDAIEWIAQQPWCDGNIGMIGGSYNGWVQYCAAVEKPPHLKTIIPNVALADPFHDLPYRDGIFLAGSLWWCMVVEENATADASGKKMEAINNKNWTKLLDHQPASELDSMVFGRKLDYYQKWVKHNTKDDYWQQSATVEKLREIEIPVFIQSGWFDAQLQDSKLAYNALITAGNQNVKLIIGPWGHTDRESKYHEEEFMGEAADDINLQQQYIRWFDHWLKGKENGIMDEPKVQLYARNSNKWYSDDTYPLSYTADKKLYLSSTGKANLKTNDGTLTSDPNSVNKQMDTYIYNPENVPIYTRKMFVQGDFDTLRQILTGRKDYLFYQTPPFRKAQTILGQISARIYASSSAVDTDWFTVLVVLDDRDKIIDLISLGTLRAKYRNSFETPELLEKDKVYPFDIDMSHNGLQLEKGQKLGLIITSSFAYPLFGINLNTGKNNQIETEFKTAEQKIFHTQAYKSYISLPMVED